MPQRDLKIVPAPKSDVGVLVPTFSGPVAKGKGEFTYRCGHCKTVLLETIAKDQVQGALIKCFKCGKYNGSPPPSDSH